MKSKKQTSTKLVRLDLAIPFITELKKRDVDYSVVLTELELSENNFFEVDFFISANKMYKMLESLSEIASDSSLAICIGKNLDIAKWPLFTEAMKNSVTLNDFFLNFIQKSKSLSSTINYTLSIESEITIFKLNRTLTPNITPAQADSFYIGLFDNIFSNILASECDLNEIKFQVCDPSVVPAALSHLNVYKGDLQGTQIYFPTSWLARSLAVNTDPKSIATEVQDSQLPPTELIESLKLALQPYIHKPHLTAEKACEYCDYDLRTITKLLKKKNTSITKIISSMRSEKACQLLATTKNDVSQVAEQVGYTDLSTFSKSFKKWVGVSPMDYRRHHK